MSHARLRCLPRSLRAVAQRPHGSVLAPARTRAASTAVARQPPPTDPVTAAVADELGPLLANEQYRAVKLRTTRQSRPISDVLSRHLDGLFEPLVFPPELARRILTHASHIDAIRGHNARLSFMGRRVLEAYLLLFLHSVPPPKMPAHRRAQHDHQAIADRALNTYLLGEHVAPRWDLAPVLRWTPPTALDGAHREPGSADAPGRTPKLQFGGVGLYKITGTAVEALVGGVFHQFGGTVASRLFHTRLLPHVARIRGADNALPDRFRQHALELCDRMGGENAPLVPRALRPAPAQVDASPMVATAVVAEAGAQEDAERGEETREGALVGEAGAPRRVEATSFARERQSAEPVRTEKLKLAM